MNRIFHSKMRVFHVEYTLLTGQQYSKSYISTVNDHLQEHLVPTMLDRAMCSDWNFSSQVTLKTRVMI